MYYVEVAARVLIGLVFLVSMLGKVTSAARFRAFQAELRDMRVVAGRFIRPVAVVVCAAEAAVVSLAVVRAVAGFVVAAGLLLVFAAAIAVVVRRKTGAHCRCFGFQSGRLGMRHVARNAALTGVCVVGIAAALRSPGIAGDAAFLLPATVIGVMSAAAIVFFDDLVFVVRG
jgi:hypothetical protein